MSCKSGPCSGAAFSREDEKPGAARVVVPATSFGSGVFAGAANVIGKQVTLANRVHTSPA